MEPRTVFINNKATYEYDLPESKTYQISKKEFDVVGDEIYLDWENVLDRHAITLQEKNKKKLSSHGLNGQLFPPVGTKISGFTYQDKNSNHESYWADITLPNGERIRTQIYHPLTHDFLVQTHENNVHQKEIFFGALAKTADSKEYFLQSPAEPQTLMPEPKLVNLEEYCTVNVNLKDHIDDNTNIPANTIYVYPHENDNNTEWIAYRTAETQKIKLSETNNHPYFKTNKAKQGAFCLPPNFNWNEPKQKISIEEKKLPESTSPNSSSIDTEFFIVFLESAETRRAPIDLFVENEKAKIIDHITKEGHLPNISLQERAEIARQCCKLISQEHKKGNLVENINSKNFLYSKNKQEVSLATDNLIIKKDTSKSEQTKESNTRNLGFALSKIFAHKRDKLGWFLCKEMTDPNTKLCLPITVAEKLLSVYSADKKCKLPDFTARCFQRLEKRASDSLKDYVRKRENLGALAKNLSTLAPPLKRPLSHFEQEILIKLVDLMPEYTTWNIPKNLDKLLDEKNNRSAFILLSYLDHLERNKHFSKHAKNEVKNAIKSFFDSEFSDKLQNPYVEKFKRYAGDITGLVTDPKEQLFIHKMIILFPNHWKTLQQVRDVYKNTPARDLLLSTIKYKEKAQHGRHKKGNKAVDELVTKMFSNDFKNATSKKINQERNRFLKGEDSRYKYGTLGFKRSESLRQQTIVAPTSSTSDKWGQFKTAYEGISVVSKKEEKEKLEFIYDMIIHFSECWEKLEDIQTIYTDKKLRDFLLGAVKYKEKTKDTAVDNLVEKLIFLKSTQNVEVIKFLAGKDEYRSNSTKFFGLRHKSNRKEREEIYIPIMRKN